MSDDKAKQLLAEIRKADQAIERAVKARDLLIKAAGEARISHREIMEAANLGRTRVHQIINEP